MLPTCCFDQWKKYVLLNNFDENYFNNSIQNSDTILFNSNKTTLIPIKNPKLGNNNIRFIIVEEKEVKIIFYIGEQHMSIKIFT